MNKSNLYFPCERKLCKKNHFLLSLRLNKAFDAQTGTPEGGQSDLILMTSYLWSHALAMHTGDIVD